MPGRIDVDLRELDRATRRMLRATNDLRPVWRKLRTPLRKDQKSHIRSQAGPDGPWRPLAASTREARLSKGGRSGKFTKRGKLRKPVARKLGRMLSARLTSGAKIRAQRKELSITSKVKWAGIHQHGGRAGRGARIPARPFMYIDDGFMAVTVGLIEQYITGAWEK